MDESRAAFESWYLTEYPAASFTRHQLYLDLYLWEHAQVCWNAWQAALSYPNKHTVGAGHLNDGSNIPNDGKSGVGSIGFHLNYDKSTQNSDT